VNPKKILVCGGDIRSIYMANFFQSQGKEVSLFALDNLLQNCSIKENSAIEDAEAVVFGLPAVKKDMTVNAPMCDEVIEFEAILKKIEKNTIVAGGRFSDEALALLAHYDLKSIDYSTDEVFQIENAFYTAEGAVESIIRNTEKSTSELKMLITGYGRISKALCIMMASLGSDITVYARRAEQRAWAVMQGYSETNSLTYLGQYDVIVNTVPYNLFSENQLYTVKKDGVIIDLSARPGYVNKDICEKRKIKLLFLPGLPASSAPRSAGEAAARAVMRMCSEI